MRKLWLLATVAVFCPSADTPHASQAGPVAERHRSPIDVAVLPGARLALAANHTSDSVSLVDLAAGKILAEQACGRYPSAVACSPDGRRAAVSNLWSGTLSLWGIRGSTLAAAGTVSVGSQPRGLAFAADGGRIYVALAGANEVAEVDWTAQKVLRRWPAPVEPRRVALTPDGHFLVAVSSRSAEVRCWDTRTGRERWKQLLGGALTLHGLALSPDGKEVIVPHSQDRGRAIAKQTIEEGWAIDNRLSRLLLEPDRNTDFWQVALDARGAAVGDPCAAAFSARGDGLAVAAGGTHELLLFRAADIPWVGGDPGDLLSPELARDDGRFRRVPLGGRPVAVQFIGDTGQAVVANYLLDALQVVDVRSGTLVRTIPLGGPSRPSLARRGEAIFYDANRSHHQWFSCHTCHPDGHTSGRAFDTLNDESYGNPKLTPSLRGVARTGPWTWHGWQKDLGAAVEKSLTHTLFGSKPTADDVRAVVAFLNTLEHPPNPHRRANGSLSAEAERGRALFNGKGRCSHCHQGEDYTSAKNYDVGLASDNSDFELWNPPSLRGLFDRGPFLHDGRAETLEELLTSDHAPEKLGGKRLTPEERRDLTEFLRSL